MKWFVSTGVLIFLVACGTTHFVDEDSLSRTATVLGMVYDLDRRPVAGVVVTMDTGSLTATTDVRGHFAIGPVPFSRHTLHYTKEGYEPAQLTFTYSEASQNTYIQLASRDQLYDAAMQAIESEQFDDAWGLVDRAEAFSGQTATSTFLRAGVEARRQKPLAAVGRIENYLASHPDQASLELMLADLYEKALKDRNKALMALMKAQALDDNAAVRQRIGDLQTK